MFARLAADLARDHRVLVPDFRGHGRSSVPEKQWQITDLADDLVKLLDQIDVKRITLLGFSMGGMAAVHFALRYAGRMEALALVGTSAGAEDVLRAAEIRTLARLIQVAGPPRFLAREAARATFSAGFRKANPASVTRWESAVQAMGGPALIHALRAVGSRPSAMDRLEEISVPTVVVTGTRDRIVKPHWATAMQRRLRRSRLISYPGVGHAVPIERPEQLAGLVRDLRSGAFSKEV
jgi:pimeloyl-ACP methyl ester carboxylesterase